jgi:membrane-bound lytic murein transglycosylase D
MRNVRPNWWLGLALLAAPAPRAEAAPPKGAVTLPNVPASVKSSPANPAPKPTTTPAPRTPPTATPTASPTATATPTASPTATATARPTATATASPTATPSPSPSPSPKTNSAPRGSTANAAIAKAVAPYPAAAASENLVKPAKAGLDDKNAAKAKPRAVASRSTKTLATRLSARAPGDALRRAASDGDLPTLPESPELRALREADRELFRPGSSPTSGAWSNDLPGPLLDPSKPVVRSSGLAPVPLLPEVGASDSTRDMSWLMSLSLPDMPARWDARVVRYLNYYHDEPRGRSLLAGWVRKSGRYGATIRRVFRDRGLPDDLVWVALIESGFDPAIRSSAGAAGLWQLMPEGAKAFGLAIDRWIDERYDAERATEAAARYLYDLHRRLGNWELALAAYNMGHGALLNAIRKYNTNDFWELTKHEAGVPYETALYVPKIIAVAVAAKNASAFGLDSVRIEPPLAFDAVAVPSGTNVTTIAAAAGVLPSVIEALNPQLRKGRTPPLSPSSEITAWTVRVPQGKGIAVSRKLAPRPGKDRDSEADDTAANAAESAAASAEPVPADPDARRADDPAGHGTLSFSPNAMPSSTAMLPPISTVPAPAPAAPPSAAEKMKAAPPLGADEKLVVVHPADPPRFPGRTRVFYRIAAGDSLRDIAAAFHVTADELQRWNPLDPSARLQEGMTLQVFVKDGTDLSRVEHLAESAVRCLTVASEEFFAYFESLRGRKRTTIVVENGETWERLAKRFNLTLGQLERINQRSRFEKLVPKETLVVYAPLNKNVAHQADAVAGGPAALGPVVAPNPEDLPEPPELPDVETSEAGGEDGFGPSAQSRRLTR